MMSAFTVQPAVLATETPIGEPSRGEALARWSFTASWCERLALLLIGGLVLATAVLHDAVSMMPDLRPATGETAPAGSNSVMPSAPADGVLTLVIPRGAAADQQAGGRGYEMPPVISLHVGDRIVIRNDDAEPHMILYAWVLPGETNERTFTAPGSEVYSSGCGLHAASFLNFTTIFVGE